MIQYVKKFVIEAVQNQENQKFLAKVFGMIILIFSPIKEVLFSVGFLVIADLITGILAAKKKGQKIESYRFRQTVSKSATYLLAVCSAFLTQKYLLNDTVPIVPVISGLIGGSELLSLYENLSALSGIPLADKIKSILQPPKVENQSSSSDSTKRE